MNLNVFLDNYYKLSHPIKFLKEVKNSIKNAWMRITKGYCYSDIWDYDDWFKSITPKMLRDLADKGWAYPGVEPYDTPEKWHDWLYSIADLIEASAEDEDEENEFATDFYTLNKDDPKYKEIASLYYERAKEIHSQRKVMLISAMKSFSEGIVEGILWD